MLRKTPVVLTADPTLRDGRPSPRAQIDVGSAPRPVRGHGFVLTIQRGQTLAGGVAYSVRLALTA